MRSLLVTIAGALLVCAAVTTSAWALQTALLPPPEHGDLAALNAVARLDRYRFVESEVRVDGGPAVRARCLSGWYPRRGELLRLGRATSILDVGRHGLAVDGRLRGEPVASLLLAACPRVLGPTVERLLQTGAKTSVTRAWFDRPALAVRIGEPTGVRLTLYLSPGRDLLLGVAVRGPHTRGLSRIRALPLTAARLGLIEGHR